MGRRKYYKASSKLFKNEKKIFYKVAEPRREALP